MTINTRLAPLLRHLGDVHGLADRRLIRAEVAAHAAERHADQRVVDRAMEPGAVLANDAKPRHLLAQLADESLVAIHAWIV